MSWCRHCGHKTVTKPLFTSTFEHCESCEPTVKPLEVITKASLDTTENKPQFHLNDTWKGKSGTVYTIVSDQTLANGTRMLAFYSYVNGEVQISEEDAILMVNDGTLSRHYG